MRKPVLVPIQPSLPKIVPTAGHPGKLIISENDVADRDGVWCVSGSGCNGACLLGQNGKILDDAVRGLDTPVRLLTLQGGLAVVEVRAQDGIVRPWLFDERLRLLSRSARPAGDEIYPIEPGGKEAVAAAEALGAACVALLSDAAAILSDNQVRELMALPQTVRLELTALAWSAIRHPGADDAYRTGEHKERVDRILSLNWLEVTQRMLELGRPTAPALSHDGEAFDVKIIVFDAYKAVAQIRDTADSDPWLLLLDVFELQHRYYGKSTRAIIFPRKWTFIAGHGFDWGWAHAWIGHALHLLVRLGADTAAWASQPTSLAILGRPHYWQHMGHQIWNTNSTLLRALEQAKLRGEPPPDYWDIAAAAGVEVYGPIEDFFPEFAGRVHRRAPDVDGAFIEAARQHQTLLFDVFHEVPTQSRTRMRLGIAKDPDIQALFRDDAARIFSGPDASQPVVVLGVRLQNRTASDLLETYVHIVRHLAESGPLIVILDGLTTSPRGGVFKTYSVPGNDYEFMNRERAFEAQFRALTDGLPITVIGCIGKPIRECLFWLGFADIFVAPHGTGAAKYRWIHNMPGLLLTSSQNVRFGHALRIYEAEGNVENPAELLYTLPEEVEDDLPGDRTYDEEGRLHDRWWLGLINHNFRIKDRSSLAARIADLFRRTIASHPRPGDTWREELCRVEQEQAE